MNWFNIFNFDLFYVYTNGENNEEEKLEKIWNGNV